MNQDCVVRVVDDDADLLKAISFFFKQKKVPHALYSNPLAFLAEFDRQAPGCILMDVNMPEMSGVEVQKKLNTEGCKLPIVFLTAFADLNLAVSVFREGAIDFLQKPFEPEELLQAVYRAFEADGKIRRNQSLTSPQSLFESLTHRERQVLRDVANHLTNKLIAEHLGISERTVEFHRFSGLKKLGLKKADEVAAFFADMRRQGLMKGMY